MQIMIKLYIPKYEDLWFRQMFMADEETMSYNHAWGGTIPFPQQEWNEWYDYWVLNSEGKRFQLLCDAARENGVEFLYDDIAIDNPAISLFLNSGFAEAYRTSEYIMLKKDL